jgi:hypothetical protein
LFFGIVIFAKLNICFIVSWFSYLWEVDIWLICVVNLLKKYHMLIYMTLMYSERETPQKKVWKESQTLSNVQ